MAKVSVRGLDELVEALKRVNAAVEVSVSAALMAGGYVLEAAVKQDMAQPKAGRFYGRHQASAPGESPAMDSGVLAASIGTEADGERSVVVGTNSEYAEPLEFGTARMAARPFMGPNAEAKRDEIAEAARAMLKQIVDGAAHV